MSVPGWQLGRPKSVDDLVLSLGRLQSWLDVELAVSEPTLAEAQRALSRSWDVRLWGQCDT